MGYFLGKMEKASSPLWLIFIEETEVLACLVDKDNYFYLGKPREWDGNNKDDLLAALDSSLGEALSLFGEEEGPDSVVFVLSPNWLGEEGKIIDSKKQILKEICADLSFNPLGFLVGDEALALGVESAVFVYLAQGFYRFSLLEDGKVKMRKQIENGLTISSKELKEGLATFLNDNKVKEIYIFGEVEDEKEIVSEIDGSVFLNWREVFLRWIEIILGEKPKDGIEKRAKESDVFSETGTNQEFLEDSPEDEEEKILTENGDNRVLTSDSFLEEEISKREIKRGDSFGFVEEDINELLETNEAVEAVSEEVKQEKIEVSFDSDKKGDFFDEKEGNREESAGASDYLEKETERKKNSFRLDLIKSFLSKSTKIFSWKRKKLLFIAALLILLASFILVAFKVTVEIRLTPEKIEKEFKVRLLKTAKKKDLKEGVIPVEEEIYEREKEKSAFVTGEKLIGEKAKGEVTIFNRTAEVQDLKEGTIISGPGGLKFSLLESVKVASKTADLSSGVDRWGEAKVPVIAVNFGAEYNLASQSVFTIEKFSKNDFLARNENAFTGGTSRVIRAVSKDDLNNLLKNLKDDLEKEVRNEILLLSEKGEKVFPETLFLEVIEKDFDSSVGDEKNEVHLRLKVKASFLKLKPEVLSELVVALVGGEREDFNLLEGKEEINFSLEKFVENGALGNLVVKVYLIPRIDHSSLKRELCLKTKAKAAEKLKGLPRLYQYKMIFSPKVFEIFPFLPPFQKNIRILIKE